MIAHIRLATRGTIGYENTHPFVMGDISGRRWTLAHNGTIFEGSCLSSLSHRQQGQTDSERILSYTIGRVNEKLEQKKELSADVRPYELSEQSVLLQERGGGGLVHHTAGPS